MKSLFGSGSFALPVKTMRAHKTKKTRKKVECFDSMKSASAALGLPEELLKEAKGLGCPGFRGSRIYGEEVRSWLESNPMDAPGIDEGSLIGLRKKFLRTRIEQENFKLSAMRGEHMAIGEIIETLTTLVAEINMIIRGIEDEIPLAIAGMTVAAARLAIRSRFDKMREKIHAPLAEYRTAQAALEQSK